MVSVVLIILTMPVALLLNFISIGVGIVVWVREKRVPYWLLLNIVAIVALIVGSSFLRSLLPLLHSVLFEL